MFALFEDRLAGLGDSAEPAAWLFEQLITAQSADWSVCAAHMAAARAAGHWVVAALPYELGGVFEPSLKSPPAAVRFWVFAQRKTLNQDQLNDFLSEQCAAVPEPAQVAGVGGVKAPWDFAAYQAAVNTIQNYIRAGDCYQVNLTFSLQFDFYGHPLALYLALRQQQATRYGGLILDTNQPIVSLSPELFVEKQGNRLRVRPMKGTAARQSDGKADQLAAEALANSAKNRAENVMIVDLLRNDLGKLAHTGSVEVSQLFSVEAYPTVWQMVSEVTALVPPDVQPEQLMPALFPCGSITGAPKLRAMQIIQEVESAPRGIYTGALGWFAPNGDCRLNVAIRTLSLQQTGLDHGVGILGIGSGVVQDSDAADEWRECWLKARFLTDLPSKLPSKLGIIETLRLIVSPDHGGQFPLLDAHLNRLTHSAGWLGFTVDVAALRTRLRQLADEKARAQAKGAWRVRVAFRQCLSQGLKQNAEPDITVFPLHPEPALLRHVTVSPLVLDGQHPLRRHKTTWRREYDQALADMAADPACFDVLFFNHQGYLMEGARSTVLACIDGRWVTPPVASGALPGVWRAEVLAGRVADFADVQQANITLADLQRATRIVCGNAVRGGVEVRLQARVSARHGKPYI